MSDNLFRFTLVYEFSFCKLSQIWICLYLKYFLRQKAVLYNFWAAIYVFLFLHFLKNYSRSCLKKSLNSRICMTNIVCTWNRIDLLQHSNILWSNFRNTFNLVSKLTMDVQMLAIIFIYQVDDRLWVKNKIINKKKIKYLISQDPIRKTNVHPKEIGLSAVRERFWKWTDIFKIDCEYFPY